MDLMPKEAGMWKDNREKSGAGKGGLRWMGAGLEFCGVIAVFSYIGYKLDAFFDTGPFLFLAGFFVSFLGMIYLFYKDSK